MRLSSVFAAAGVALFAAVSAATVSAQSLPASPVIVIGTADIEPAKYDWVSEAGQKAIQALIDARKAGQVAAFVFAGAPGGNFWSYKSALKATDPYSLTELARQALQSCEYLANAPCYLVTINGKDARDATGLLPAQPRQLVRPPTTFDVEFIPFLSREDQVKMRGYGTQSGPRAMVISSAPGAVWRGGDNSIAAATAAMAECQKNYPNNACLLYAVNDRVIFSPGGPY